MKKIFAILLALVVLCSFAACGGNNGSEVKLPDSGNTNNEPEVKLPASALEILETVWATYGEEEMFYGMGGDWDNMVENAPGAVTNEEFMTSSLVVPADHVECITEAASLLHAMNANTFTSAAYKVTDSAEFVADIEDAILNNHWFCGFPEVLVIVTLGDYVVVAFGNGEVVANFQAKLVAAYPDAVVAANKTIE